VTRFPTSAADLQAMGFPPPSDIWTVGGERAPEVSRGGLSMAITPIPGQPGLFLDKSIRWVGEEWVCPLIRPGVTYRTPTSSEVAAVTSSWQRDLAYCLAQMRSTTARRRRRKWRWARRTRGRDYARLLAVGPSSKRPNPILRETTFRIGETKHEARWNTIMVGDPPICIRLLDWIDNGEGGMVMRSQSSSPIAAFTHGRSKPARNPR
jgi:hypothetical protein